ncbi:MAG: tetratricopeptide repeat protein [Candidatus Sungbacteria bacterium]|nr:tetratricopeptide repeat protein [Candidatus Sungbacteria bacterium]
MSFAIDELEAERARFPSDVRAKAFLATLYSAAGRPNEAIEVVNEALTISDRRQQFYFVAAEAYLNAGQNEQAVQALRRAYELAPDYPEAIANLATVLIISGQENEAESLLEKHFGKRLVAQERYANAYAQRGNFAKAILVWKEIVAGNQLNAESHASLGSVYAQAGRTREAIAEIEEAMRLEPRFKPRGEQIIREIRENRLR